MSLTGKRATGYIFDDVWKTEMKIEDVKIVQRVQAALDETPSGRMVVVQRRDAVAFAQLVGQSVNPKPKDKAMRLSIRLTTKWLGFANDAIAQQVARRLS